MLRTFLNAPMKVNVLIKEIEQLYNWEEKIFMTAETQNLSCYYET